MGPDVTLPGPGDPETWGPPTEHPNDPRTVEISHDENCAEGGCEGECIPEIEPDYEPMMEPDEAREWAGVDGLW